MHLKKVRQTALRCIYCISNRFKYSWSSTSWKCMYRFGGGVCLGGSRGINGIKVLGCFKPVCNFPKCCTIFLGVLLFAHLVFPWWPCYHYKLYIKWCSKTCSSDTEVLNSQHSSFVTLHHLSPYIKHSTDLLYLFLIGTAFLLSFWENEARLWRLDKGRPEYSFPMQIFCSINP